MTSRPAESQSLLSGTELKTLLEDYQSSAKVLGRVEFCWERDDNVPTYQMEEAQKELSAARLALEEYVERRTLTAEEWAVLQTWIPGGVGGPITDRLVDKILKNAASGRSTESGVPK